jgi:hypothetical protein
MDEQPVAVVETSDFSVIVAATEKAIRERDCPWCAAKAGEKCLQKPSIFETHPERFPEGITPEEYLAS